MIDLKLETSEDNMARLYIGIDPGKNGGVAFIRGRDVRAEKMPEIDHDLWQMLAGKDPATVVIEQVASSPQMGVKSAFTFGRGVGLIRGICIAAGLQMVYVTPSKWQQEFGLVMPRNGRTVGRGDTEKKKRNRSRACELFPQLKITNAIADALLLAEYGKRKGL